MHSLLKLVQAKRGWPVLLNTSFNVKGRPIINRIDHALRVLIATDGLRGVVIEGWLFDANGAKEAITS